MSIVQRDGRKGLSYGLVHLSSAVEFASLLHASLGLTSIVDGRNLACQALTGKEPHLCHCLLVPRLSCSSSALS